MTPPNCLNNGGAVAGRASNRSLCASWTNWMLLRISTICEFPPETGWKHCPAIGEDSTASESTTNTGFVSSGQKTECMMSRSPITTDMPHDRQLGF